MSKKERFNVLDKFIILGFVVLLLSVVVILLRTAHDTVSICGGNEYVLTQDKDHYECCKGQKIKEYIDESRIEYVEENKIVCFEVKKNDFFY